MHNEFWHNAWEKGNPGWRQGKVNSRLQRYWPELQLQPGQRVFVPLCGDSIDLLWLAEQGYHVLGAELSEMAVERFFTDNQLQHTVSASGEHKRYASASPAQSRTEQAADGQGGSIEILCGDFFSLSPTQLEGTAAVYDRAATVAMSPELRTDYALQIKCLVEPGTPVLLVSISYDQDKMNGPPFSVPDSDVRRLYGDAFDIGVLGSSSGPEILGNLADRGLDTLDETVYRLTRR